MAMSVSIYMHRVLLKQMRLK